MVGIECRACGEHVLLRQEAGKMDHEIYEAISTGKLKTLKVGGRRLVRPDALSDWLQSHAAN